MQRRCFEAESVGSLVPKKPFLGEIVSLYDEAINIAIDDGLLISVVSNLDSMTAMGIHVPALFDIPPVCLCSHSTRMKKGSSVYFHKKHLIIGDFTIGTGNASPWSGTVCPEHIKGFGPTAIQLLSRFLLAQGKEGGLLAVNFPDFEESVYVTKGKKMLKNIHLKGDPPVATGFAGLVGLGPGFTPSGDDFLCGVLLGEVVLLESGYTTDEDYYNGSNLHSILIEKVEIAERLCQTTIGGRTLLWLALQTRFPRYLIETTRKLSAFGGEVEIANAIEKAVNHGTTSGTDALSGLLWYFKWIFRLRRMSVFPMESRKS